MSEQSEKIHQNVKQYYGQVLKSSESLLTNACCVGKSNLTASQKKVMNMINQQIVSKFYGCGSPVPDCLQGKTVVDLGCGTGVDVYISSYFAKESGKVIGIDMTESQLQVAKKHCKQMMEKFGFEKPNVEFILGRIEKIPLEDESVDVVISNCVVNLTPNKKDVFTQIRRILKPGGQLYFSDVYANLRIGQELRNDKVLWGECLSGALYIEDFRRIMDDLGFKDCRVMSKSNLSINNTQIQKKFSDIRLYSITYRCFKLSDLQDRCEDYGEKVKYLGGVEDHQNQFILDSQHVFNKGQQVDVCGNTASMLKNTRFGKYFTVDQRGQHRGLFDCSKGGKTSEGCCEESKKTSEECCKESKKTSEGCCQQSKKTSEECCQDSGSCG